MKKVTFFGMLLLIGFFFTGCAGNAHIEKDETVNFKNYKTFAWIETTESKDEKDKKVSDLTEQNLKKYVNSELTKQGWKEVKNKPDVLISYDALVEKNLKEQTNPVYTQPYSRFFFNPYTRRWGRIYYPSQFLGYDNESYEVREGTITISMIDSRTEKTVWQGWSTSELKSRHMTSKEIQNSVKNIFRKFDIAKN
ncbi:DUF4136 domain-containing protein [Chitinophagaceae bacterium LB-8]|uniref:DUF4136 domain-containing protein n=1 Tax=Paraflavisolibacter caeni TaxID=2982496 RepID=A0A9X2Y2L4_9BACT|nr:DUF4136 domain-containing protein [Paraflavisolibacter caeni]MCU7552723.1 DUF4136 domain-containing protein [Paraflavisolibacter caeni]